MSRPASSSGLYGRTPFTCSTVVSIVKVGTISTSPPIITATSAKTVRTAVFALNECVSVQHVGYSAATGMAPPKPSTRVGAVLALRTVMNKL